MSGEHCPEGVVSRATFAAWQTLARHVPPGVYLAGDAALAVHLLHRRAAGLLFLYHERSVDLERLVVDLSKVELFAVTHRVRGVLRCRLAGAEVEFRDADEPRPETLLEMPRLVAGIRVAGLHDMIALKLGDIARRRCLVDYFDLMSIEERTSIPLESGIRFYLERFRVKEGSDELVRLVNALGYLDDVPEDDTLPVGQRTLAGWWARRQARLVRTLAQT